MYVRVLFTSEGRVEQEIDRQTCAAPAVIQMLYQCVVVKTKLGMKVKLSVYRSFYICTLTYGHELLVVTERTRLQIKVQKYSQKLAFLQRLSELPFRG